MKITATREDQEKANRDLRDSMYTSRYADSEKAKLMSQPLQEAAALTGITVSPVNAPPSPYRL